MTIEELKRMKTNLNMSSREIADRSGVPFPTVHKIFCGVTKTPRHDTIVKIEEALRSEFLPARYFDHPIPGAPAYLAEDNLKFEEQSDGSSFVTDVEFAYGDDPENLKVKASKRPQKTSSEYPRQGEYTVEDYYGLPDEKRVELIDGVIYDMAAPTAEHQIIAVQIVAQLLPCIEKHKDCQVFISPIDVQLDKDNKTMVQPDIVIVCRRDTVIGRCIYGPPDFVLEVLSNSTRKKDMFIKLGKYCKAGCREYWIVDPKEQSVTIYDFEQDGDVSHYTFDDKVPVLVSEGRCKVDFSVIKERLAWGSCE